MASENYDMLTQCEHVLKRADMYIGSIEVVNEIRWVYNPEKKKIVRKDVVYNPGLEQCVMELITNATDRTVDPKNKVTKIDVTVTDNTIEVTNDGLGIPVEIHKKHQIYIPEMIFGNLLSGSNFDDTKKRITGGKNGIGAKAANIFSKSFTIITICSGKKYEQTFTNNMKNKTKPKITKVRTKDSTKIIFEPDLPRFGMKTLNENDTISLIHKRTIDASGVTPRKVSVSYCGTKIPNPRDFQEYMDLFVGSKTETPRIFMEVSDRWTVGFALNPFPSHVQVSFVNGICTEDGGSHVNHVLEPILNRVMKDLQEKYKDLTIRKSYIKDNIIVFVKSLIENPSFGSQTKRLHTTTVAKFGSRVQLKDPVIKKIIKLGITNGIQELARAKEFRDLKKTDGKKKARLNDIPKLDDANWAGTSRSKDCVLLLTEGDSAKSTALAGMSVVGKDRYGVFPLKGKLLNVRDISSSKINKNDEITNIKKILGLVQDEKYDKTTKGLRYGKIMIMTDADVDGHHIKGLLMNYIGFFWPKLLENGFICSLLTPIVKVFRRSTVKNFYDLESYESWKENTPNHKSWRVKYYKGLGTSTSQEAKEYFRNLVTNQINYTFGSTKDQKSLELAFSDSKKKNTDKRKEWILNTLKSKPKVDYSIKNVPVNDFINKELVQFSIYDTQRSLPNVIDGLKVSQRKILYCCLKRKLFAKSDGSGEIKVAQLAGYVSEHSSYHHGEASLQGAIVGMAQNFVGTGNMNILYPSGQFGSRQMNGKDASSPRYIFTYLNSWVSTIFNEYDNQLLKYLDDDGVSIEPEFYVPVLPMLLINGSDGIGTGWSTTVPCFNPVDIINNLKKLIKDENSNIEEMTPWYRGFKGKIIHVDTNEWRSEGVLSIDRGTRETLVIVNELPVGTVNQTGKKSIHDFKVYLDLLEQKDDILSYKNSSSDENVSFEVVFRTKDTSNWDEYTFLDKLKLIGMIKATNMHAFNNRNVIKRYESAEEILWEFFKYRRTFYRKRKKHMVQLLTDELEKVSEKARFIKMVVDNEIVVFRRPKGELMEELQTKEFKCAEILLDIKIHAFTLEKLNELNSKVQKLAVELGELKRTSIETMWIGELEKV